MEKLITTEQDGAAVRYSVKGQEWTPEALEELRREHGILFRADGVVPLRIRGSMLRLGIEDDGVLFFSPDAPCFHVSYAPSLLRTLEEAVELLTPPDRS